LRNLLKGLTIFAGATIMGDGRAILILDVPGLAVHASVLSEQRQLKAVADPAAAGPAEEKHSLLLFAGDDEARMAVPFSNVLRLERFACADVERSEGRDVVQFMGDIMPLVHLSDLLPERRREPRDAPVSPGPGDHIHVIVYPNGGARVGLVVNRIFDTIEQSLATLRPATRRGTLGSMVIQDRVTEILDVAQICAGFVRIPVPITEPEEVAV
jgi:two-component system chemotaxis sensor kinase CheA